MTKQLLKKLISDDEIEEIKQNLKDYFSTLVEWQSEIKIEEKYKENRNDN